MKKIKLLLASAVIAILMTSCEIILPLAATSNPVGSKVGTAEATIYLGIFTFDQDASIRTAAKNGGITKISTVDIRRKDVLGIVLTYETIVTGE